MSTAQPHREGLPPLAVTAAALGGLSAGVALALLVGALVLGPAQAGSSGAEGLGLPDLTGLEEASSLSDGVAAADIVIDVGGAVARPGLQRLRAGDRVGDAIKAAGGFAPRVDVAEADRTLNLAQPLSDGAKVLVPELGRDGPMTAAGDGRIDVNAADQAALESLPGIGPVTAARIIEARSQRRFTSVGELLSRGVVGQAVFEDIKDLVSASG